MMKLKELVHREIDQLNPEAMQQVYALVQALRHQRPASAPQDPEAAPAWQRSQQLLAVCPGELSKDVRAERR